MRKTMRALPGLLLLGLLMRDAAAQDNWPPLPDRDGAVEVPAQEWPLRPGPRRVRVLVHYPGGQRAAVTPQTGIMLTLHNWGGTDCVGTADPRTLVREFQVIALCVNYLQSGPEDSINGPEPYDFGYLQALDALRAVWWMQDGLRKQNAAFDSSRYFATGGSGGGNVTLMAGKLAPRTFAGLVDLCGMKKLSDDIAFNLPGGSALNARYSRDAAHPNHLSADHQQLRFVGNPEHLKVLKTLKPSARLIVVHGRDDTLCPFADAEELVLMMQQQGLTVEPHFIGKPDLDGTAFTSSGHSLGNRTEIVKKVAGRYLRLDSPDALRRSEPSDFDRREVIRYPTSSGRFEIDYAAGYPVGRFVPD